MKASERQTVRASKRQSVYPAVTLHASRFTLHAQGAFTLIEIMVVVGIMGLILAMGIPSIYHMWHKESLQKTTNDIIELCGRARAQAIMRGEVAEIVIRPQARRVEIVGAPPPRETGLPRQSTEQTLTTSGAASSVQWAETIGLEMLDVNLSEYKEADFARVRFFPNGTSDELTLILRSDQNEWRKISLEITTGLASFEADPQKFAK
jgi:prepilin-type N-terminal cleavage/methylation domain-containing protein